MEKMEQIDAGQQKIPEEAPVKPIYSFHVSADSMEVEMELQGDGPSTLPPVYEDIIGELAGIGVKFGIHTEFLQGFCARPVFGRRFFVANGKHAEKGTDGYLHFLVETDRSLRPKERDDGTVDYHDLGFTQNILKGQPICEIHAAKKGANGMDVYGKVLEGTIGKGPPSPKGKNTELNADGTLLVASCDGSVSVTRGVASVIDQLRINGNVDNSTGNVDFVGDIFIKGAVFPGFRVIAKGDVVIQGNAESAYVEATGDITISGGVNGMDRGQIIAGGSVKCKYIQSASITAGGDVYTDTIIHSTIQCGGNLEVVGQRGRLIGGRVTVAGYLKATTIGTDSHVPTVVAIDCSTDIDREIQELAVKISELDKELVKLQQLFSHISGLKQKGRMTAELVATMESAAGSFKQLQEQRASAQQAITAAKEEQLRRQTQAVDSYILCRERIHGGVTIYFGPIATHVNSSVVNARVMLVDGEIRFMN